MRALRFSNFLSAALALLLLTQCQWAGGYEDFSPKPTEPTGPCHALPKAKEDDQGLAVMSRVNVPGATCFWIDQKEVTVAAYQRWQEAIPADQVPWDSTFCRWKVLRSDPIGDASDACRAQILPFDLIPFAPKKPMRCVDFCEAEAFCRWGGKHLCHATDAFGVQTPRSSVREWALACSNDFSTVYPWGNVEQPTLCNVGQTSDACITSARAVCGALPVGEKRGCATKDGVLDMLGNVAEWLYSCNFVDQTNAAPTGCMTRGGGYDGNLESCDGETTLSSDTRQPSLGFRCCADLTPDEELLVESSSEK